jgi:hypothetical protein
MGVTAVLALGAAQAQTAHSSVNLETKYTSPGGSFGIVVDAAKNVYVSSFYGGTISKGTLSNGTYTYSTLFSSGFNEPSQIAIDAAGNLYIADGTGRKVVKETYANGSYTASTIATTTDSYLFGVALDAAGDVFYATSSSVYYLPLSNGSYQSTVLLANGFSLNYGLSLDASGNVYVADAGFSTALYKLTKSGSTYTKGAIGVTGTAISEAEGVLPDAAGNLYVTSTGSGQILKLTPTGGLNYASTSIGTQNGEGFPTFDANGLLYTAGSGGEVDTVLLGGAVSFPSTAVSTAATQVPVYFTIDTAGTLGTTLLLTQGAPNLDFTIGTGSTCTGAVTAGTTCSVNVVFTPKFPGQRRGAVDLTNSSGTVIATTLIYGTGSGPQVTYSPGAISTVAGNGTLGNGGDGMAATSAELSLPAGVAVDGAGNLYAADKNNSLIRKVTAATGLISTVAGNGTAGYSGDGAAATSAELNFPTGVAVDGAGNLYIADQSNHRIRKVTAATGLISTVAGTGTGGYVASQDTGTTAATSAELRFPYAVAVDGAGNLFIADYTNQRIRKVTAATGFISTVAGNGTGGYVASQDTGTMAATSAELQYPQGVAVDGAGNLYIGDSYNQRIRKVTAATGFISTVAGNGTAGYTSDGIAATSAELNYPAGVAVDGAGDLYVADVSNNRIRKVSAATGVISTVAGNGTANYFGDGAAATSAELQTPYGVAVDGAGNLYFGDFLSYRVRVVTATAAPLSFASTAVGATSADSPQTVTVNNIGNAGLTFSLPATGTNPSLSTGFSIGNSSTCPQVSSSSFQAGTLAGGASCTDLISFSPTVGGSIGGQLVTTDNTLNVSGSFQTATLSGTATYSTPTVTSLIPANGPTLGGNIVTITGTNLDGATAVNFGTLAATSFTIVSSTSINAVAPAGTSGAVYVTVSNPGFTSANSVQYTYTAPVVTSISPSYGLAAGGGTITITGANLNGATAVNFGAVPATILTDTATSITATIPAGTAATTVNVNVAAGTTVSNSVLYTYSAPSAYTAPTEPVGTASANQTAYVNITTPGTFNAINVLTQGATGQDFNPVTGGTCAAGTIYTVGQVCSVLYSFTPEYPGQRLGAVRLVSSSGTILATAYLFGTGTGPLVDFSTSVGTDVVTSGLTDSQDAITDAAGNLYITSGTYLAKAAAGSSTATNYVNLSAYGEITGVAIDGAGTLYVTDNQYAHVLKIVGTTVTPLVTNTLSHPQGIVADGAGNVFFTDQGTNILYEVPAGATTATVIIPSSGGLNAPTALALDNAGGLYVANQNGNTISHVAQGATVATSVATPGFTLNAPEGLAVDAAGNLYIDDRGNSRFIEVPASGAAPFVLGTQFSSYFMSIDGAGRLYVADSVNNKVFRFDRTTATPLLFPNTTVGGTSGAQNLKLENDGNASLSVASVLPSNTNFGFAGGVASGGIPGCGAPVAPGALCNVQATFTPKAVGGLIGSGIVTDNSLNVTRNTQTVALSGTATQAAQTITFTLASPVTYSAAPITLVAMGGASGNAVTFSILSGSAFGTLSGANNSVLTITGAGTIVIAANQAGSTNYLAAAQVTQTLTVNPASQTITFGALPGVTWGAADFPVIASATSGLVVSFAASGNCTIVSATTVHITAAGSCQITASQAGNANYTAATGVTQSFSIAQEPITATGGSGSATYDGTTKTPSACTVTGNYTVGLGCLNIPSVVGPNAGTTAITASVTGINGNYIVNPVSGSYIISQAPSVTTVSCSAGVTYTGLTKTPCTATVTGAGGLNQPLTVIYGANITAGVASASAAYSGDANHLPSSNSVTFAILPATQVVAFNPVPTTPDSAGNSVVLSATGGASGQPVVFSVLSGPATLANDGVTLLYTGAGTVVVAADQAGSDDGNYAAATEATATIVVKPAAAAYNAGTVPVAQQSSVLTATLNFPNGGTIGSLSYLTQGAPNLDYIGCTPGAQTKKPANPKGGTSRPTTFTCPSSKSKDGAAIPVCSVGDVYSAGQICTVSYIFQATAPGQRLGAVAAVDNNGNPMGTSYLSGLGTGPQVAFPSNAAVSLVGSGFGGPYSAAVDGLGNVFVADLSSTNGVKEIVAVNGLVNSGSAVVSVGSGFESPTGVAVDGSGNVFVSDPSSNLVKEIVAVNGVVSSTSPVKTVGGGFYRPYGLAVDGSGDVFVADYNNNAVKEIMAVSGVVSPTSQVNVIGSGYQGPRGVAVDGSGNVFVANIYGGVLEVLAVNGAVNAGSPVIAVGSGFNYPAGVAVDASGNVFVADANNSAIKEIVAVSGAVSSGSSVNTVTSGFSFLTDVALDGRGHVFAVDNFTTPSSAVKEIDLTVPSITFSDTNVGSSSSDSPQTVTVANIGYDPTSTNPLTFSGVSTGTASFVLDAANACSTSTSLEPGQTCALAVDFTPQVSGTPLTDAVTLADNNLNNISDTASPQTVALSGNGLQQTPVITVAPATIDYATASTPLSATVAYTGSIAPNGAVTFTIDSGSAVTASCSGTASPLSCTAMYPTATLSATTHTITATLAATPGFLTASGSSTLTVKPIALTVTAGSYSGTYDGNTHALSACTVSVNPDGLTCTNSPTGPVGPDVGGATVTPILSGPLANYTVTTSNGNWSITQASSITALTCPASVMYNGTAQTPCTASVTGVGGLSQPVTPVTYNSNLNAGVNTASASATFSGDANHTGSTQTVNFTIAPALLTVTAGNYSGVYDLSTHAVSACTVSANFDSLTCTDSPAQVGPDVGSGTVTPAISGSTANYTVTSNNGTWSITPLAVTLTAGSYSGVYDGAAHAPSACTSSYAGVTCANSPASVGPGVSSGTVNPVVSYVGSIAADYQITPQNGSWSITPASSVTSISCPASVVYNGTALTPCTATVTGVGGLSQSVSVTYSANTIAGTATASATFVGDANHTSSTKSTTFAITPALLTVTAGSYMGVYDGASHNVSSCIISANPDGLTCTNNPGTVGPDFGSDTVTPVISGSTSNYTVAKNNGSWSITAKPLTITAGSYSGTYNGVVHSPAACISSYSGVACTNSPASVGPGVGSGAVNPVASFGTGVAADYTVTTVAGSYSITKLGALVTPNAATKVFGTPDLALSGSLSGFLTADAVTTTYRRTSGETVAGSPYTISATLTPTAVLANYAITYDTAAFTITKATPVLTWTAPSAITYGTALSATQLNATANLSGGTFGYTPSAGTVLTAGSQTLSVLYTPADTGDYTTATASVPLMVGQATPVVAWPIPPSIVYGTGTGAAQKNATATGVGGASLPGSYFYTTPDGTIFNVGQHPLGVGFTPTDSTDYFAASAFATLTVTKATPTVTWAAPAAIIYGTALSGAQLNARSPVAGSFSYNPATGTVLQAGEQTLSVTFNPADTTDYNSSSANVQIAVDKASTTTTLAVTTTQTVTGTTATLTATVRSQIGGVPTGTVTYYNGSTVLGSAAVGTPFTTAVLPVGSDSITAVYGGDPNFVGSSSSASAVTSVAPTTVQLTSPLSRVFSPGSAVSFTVSVPLKNLQLISGTVTLYDGNTVIGTYSLPAGGILVGITPQLSVGTHSLRVVYGGNGQYPPGQSPVVTVTVSAL